MYVTLGKIPEGCIVWLLSTNNYMYYTYYTYYTVIIHNKILLLRGI